jgi:predicted amidohydrolase
MHKVKAGIIQMETRIGRYQDNVERAMSAIDRCAAESCDLVCLPEAFSTTLDFGSIEKVSEPIPGTTSELLAEKARDKGIHIIASILEKDGGEVYSSTLLLDPKGNIRSVYRRVHVFELEGRFMSRGLSGFKTCETAIGRIGLISGYDINFPESSRALFIQRAEIIACPAQIPALFSQATRLLVAARAQESSCYFLFASSVGENSAAGIRYMGRSCVMQSSIGLEPYSTEYVERDMLLADASHQEAIIFAELDMRQVRREQEENPHLKDRVPAAYGGLLEDAAAQPEARTLMWDTAVFRKGGHRV